MKKPHAPDIRKVLIDNPEGLTVARIHARLPEIPNANSVRRVLSNMPDVYIDRWTSPVRGQYQAVWQIVVPPKNCPHPDDRFAPETKWVTQ